MQVQTKRAIALHTHRAVISIVGSTYLVDFGPGVLPRKHYVSKDKTCSCGVKHCPAIEVVNRYLLSGGKRAPNPMPPCPICGAKTYRDRTWDGKYTKTLGWRCMQGGLQHFLEAKAQSIQKNQAENPVFHNL